MLNIFVVGVLFFINFVRSQQQQYDEFIVDHISSASFRGEGNLTCIPHDTKYTCDCRNADEKMYLLPLYGHVFHISISNCKWLSVAPSAIKNTHGLRSLSFTNVENLVLQEYSLEFPRFTSNTPLILEFNKFSIEEIQSHAINGNIEEIVFTSGKIGIIRPFAFTSLKDKALLLKFSGVRIDKIQPQAFKKFSVEELEFSNTEFVSSLPSRSLYELEILQYLKIQNSTFNTIHPKSISFKAVSKMIVAYNYFENLNGEWIEAPMLQSVVVKSNHMGITNIFAFKGISVHKGYTSSEKMELRFTNNTIQHENGIAPLEFDRKFQLIIKDLFYVNQFDCLNANKASDGPFFKAFSESIYFKKDEGGSKYLTLAKLLQTECVEESYWIYIVAGIISSIFVILIIIGVVIYLCIKKKRKNKLDVIVPEPRTYRETQIVLQIENAGLLKTDL